MNYLNIKYRPLLFLLAGSLFSFFPNARKPLLKIKHPNIVLILVDDLGYKDLGCYGSTFYLTPNIDKFATQGIKFTHAYASCNVCSPSRASILTGKSPARLHVTDWITGHERPFAKLTPPNWSRFLPLEATTVAEVLKKEHYATASIGKWHLGDDPKYYAENQGFDINIAGNYLGQPPSYFSPYRIPRLTDGPKGEYLTDRLTDEAMNFIINKKDSAFFLYLSYYAVHTPLQGKAQDVAIFKSRSNADSAQRNAVYAAVLKSVDENVGRVNALIDSLGLAENTIIIFASDNGGLVGRKNHITSNTPFREGKGTAYEGGVKIPFLVKWKNNIREGSVDSTPVIHADLFPTFAALTNTAYNKKDLDGLSLAPLLLQGTPLKRDALYWHYPHYHNEGATPYTSILQGDWKLIYYYENGSKELYNLRSDPSEKDNLAQKQAGITQSLFSKISLWKIKVGAQDPIVNPKYDTARANEAGNTDRNVIDN